ncbi:MAG: SIMPL domain-containing protein [Synechococcales bacterium]|nr:SIMPL domain-containing protein [Synechococcales bacterium]
MPSAIVPPSATAVRALRHIVPLALIIAGIVMVKPAPAQDQPLPQTLTVTGQGVETIPTSLAQVALGVEVNAATAEEAQQAAAQRSSSVVELLRSRNVDQLQTTGISLSPRYDYSNNQQRLVGYTATNTVSFQVATEEAGTILDDAVSAGASRIDGISFRATDEAIAEAEAEALRDATQEAQDQAAVVLETLGLTSRSIVGIQINSAQPPIPLPYARQAVASLEAADAANTEVIGGEQRVTASVTLQIGY